MTVNVQQKLEYPDTRKGSVVDEYYGTRVPEPYRWLEELDSPEVAAWIAAQNAVTYRHLESLPLREVFRTRITELWNYRKTSLPATEAGRLFYRQNSGLQRQAPVYLRDSLAAPPRLLIDPNELSPDGSVSLAAISPSPDARLLAYTLAEGGADWQTVRVRNLATGRDLDDRVRWMRFSGLSWTRDAKGFFYSRYPEPPKGQVLQAALSGHALYYHRVGTPQAEDTLIYERTDLPTWFISGGVSEDGRYLFIALAEGASNQNRLYYVDLGDPDAPDLAAPVRPVVEGDGAEFSPVGSVGHVVYVRTDRDAPNRKVVAINLEDPQPASWKTIVPEEPHAIESAALIGGRLVTEHLVDVQSRVTMFDLQGKREGEVPLPGAGVLAGLAGREDTPTIWYMFTSPLYPATVFAYEPGGKGAVPFEAAAPAVHIDAYETTRMFATSADGTRVPFFVTARKGLPRDGSSPVMLYAYGGFSVTLAPTYRPDVPAWLERGGIWVTANLRGGAEYGESWHKAGMLENKPRVYEDFIAVAEHLVREKYTSPSQLAMMGGSNGGLLVGVVMQQRPDLFAVALPAVGVLDMLRYDQFTGGRAWVSEYGSAADPEAFKFLIRYSPLHNVNPGTCYPSTLITTADHDDRVVPSHSFKFAAAMQRAQGCARPILIRVETAGSHGYRPTDRRIAELADQWAFTGAHLGMTP